MNRCKNLILFFLLTAMLLNGCAMRTVEEMYSLPKRSEEYNHLQSAIDGAMTGLDYAAPQTGENQQTVQMSDLNGDGVEEYLLFARSNGDDPMRVLIFTGADDGYTLMTTIKSQGSAFDRVEYVDIDGQPGMELVVGRRVSDQVSGYVSVYTFHNGEANLLMSSSYAKFLTCDLDSNGLSEVMILHAGETEADRGVAVLYSYLDGQMQRSAEVELSETAGHIKRIMVSKLHGGAPAVYVASSADGSAIVTDIFAMKNGVFSNISFSNESGTSVRTLRNYYVYADDIDDDGILELPSLITMAAAHGRTVEDQYLIRWFAMDLEGREVDKMYTFHNFAGGWYIQLDSRWATQTTMEETVGAHSFYIWNSEQKANVPVFTVFALTGDNRDVEAVEENRFVLYRTEGVVYAARLDSAAAEYGITQDYLISAFRLIHLDWNLGET